MKNRWSHIDMQPTLLELAGIDCDECLGESFAAALRNDVGISPQKWKLFLQPYDGGHIAVMRYPEKIIIDLTNNTAERFDLLKDPEERSPEFIPDASQFQLLIEDYFSK